MDDIKKEFVSLYEKATALELPSPTPHKDSLAPHRLPYCGQRHLFEKLTYKGSSVGFGLSYYGPLGNLIHNNIQYFMSKLGAIFGNWECVSQKGNILCPGKRDFSKDAKCPICGSHMKYVEISVKMSKRHMVGRIDTVFQPKRSTDYIIVDYKSTSSSRILLSQTKPEIYPEAGHTNQILSYCDGLNTLLEEAGNPGRVVGWLLLYVGRDNPINNKTARAGTYSKKKAASVAATLDSYDDQYHQVMFFKSLKDAQFLMDNKMCSDYDDYKKKCGMFANCALGESGVCWNERKLKSVLKDAWEDRAEDWLAIGRPSYLSRMKR